MPNPLDYEQRIDYYLAHGPFDIIHFNWGLHDLKHGGIPLEKYLGNLSILIDRMEATGAKLIYATTTPVPPVNKAKRTPESVIKFNAAAIELMKKRGVC